MPNGILSEKDLGENAVIDKINILIDAKEKLYTLVGGVPHKAARISIYQTIDALTALIQGDSAEQIQQDNKETEKWEAWCAR